MGYWTNCRKVWNGAVMKSGLNGRSAFGFVIRLAVVGIEVGAQVDGDHDVSAAVFGDAVPAERVRFGESARTAGREPLVDTRIHQGHCTVVQDAAAVVIGAEQEEREDGPAAPDFAPAFSDFRADQSAEPGRDYTEQQDGPDDEVDHRCGVPVVPVAREGQQKAYAVDVGEIEDEVRRDRDHGDQERSEPVDLLSSEPAHDGD